MNDQPEQELPNIDIDEVKVVCSSDLNHMEIWATIHNYSDQEIELRDLVWLGTKLPLRTVFGPGDVRQERVHRGRTLDNDAYARAELYWIAKESGEYCKDEYLVQFDFLDNERYAVESMEKTTLTQRV